MYAMCAMRHMHEFGTTSEQLAEIAVAIRYNAGFNPNALYRDPITVDDVLNSRMVAEPLRMLEPRETETRTLHALSEYGVMQVSLYESIARHGRIAKTYNYPVMVNGRYIMSPSPIPKFDNPKLDRNPALQLYGAGREKRIYAVPPYTTVKSLDFDDHPFEIETWSESCALCGSKESFLDEMIVDDAGKELPRDGKAFGDLLVRGPWITSGYFRGEGGEVLREGGWFATGDVATIDSDGYMTITDRSKDVIKSGGEWISSIDLENAAMAHPAVAEAAVIGIAHPKWDERPLLIVHRKTGADVTKEELIDFLGTKVAKWWLPDEIVFVDELPHTATGKILKRQIRDDYKDYKLKSLAAA